MRWRAAIIATVALNGLADAHHPGGGAHEGIGWSLEPGLVLPLFLSLAAFLIGVRRLGLRSTRGAADLAVRQRWFVSGWLILAGALVSPLHQAGERSFTAHMVEHELIMLAAAPLLVLSRPLPLLLWAFPAGMRHAIGAIAAASPVRALWRLLSGPVTATMVQAVALWVWHAPALFDLALASDGWHVAQHLSFLISALSFWSAMLSERTAPGIAALCLVGTSIVSGALGALMAFATSPWYAGYARLGLAPFGLTPAEDQQVAGLLMWVPGGLVHAGAALLVMRRLLRPSHA